MSVTEMSGVELYAPSVYKALNGVFCVYKPTGQSVFKLVHTLQLNLARGSTLFCIDFNIVCVNL